MRSCRHKASGSDEPPVPPRPFFLRPYFLCASNTPRSSNSARSTCTAWVHAREPPPAPSPGPATPVGGGRCDRRAARTPLTETASACAAEEVIEEVVEVEEVVDSAATPSGPLPVVLAGRYRSSPGVAGSLRPVPSPLARRGAFS